MFQRNLIVLDVPFVAKKYVEVNNMNYFCSDCKHFNYNKYEKGLVSCLKKNKQKKTRVGILGIKCKDKEVI